MYVADKYNNRIQKFDSNGNFIAKWGTLGFMPTYDSDGNYITKREPPATGAVKFAYPTGISVDSSNDKVYVTGFTQNHRTKV